MEAIKSIAPTEPTNEETPSGAIVARLKSQYPGRDLHRIEMTIGDAVLVFVMTGPNKGDWKKYQDEAQRATGDSDKQLAAVERAALAQIRWPERDEVLATLEKYPALVANFPEQLNELAGLEAVTTRKKL